MKKIEKHNETEKRKKSAVMQYNIDVLVVSEYTLGLFQYFVWPEFQPSFWHIHQPAIYLRTNIQARDLCVGGRGGDGGWALNERKIKSLTQRKKKCKRLTSSGAIGKLLIFRIYGITIRWCP